MEFFNQSLVALTGYAEGELTMGEVCSIEPLIVAEDRPAVIAAVQRAIREHQPFEVEYRLRTKAGDLSHCIEFGQPVYAPDGACSHFDGVIVDITDRKTTELALRASEERYRLLAETMLQGVVHQDADGRIIAMNPAAERILGQTQAEFLGSSSVEEERHTVREDGSRFPGCEHPAMVALRTGRTQSGVVMGVYNPRLKQRRWIRIDAVPLFRQGNARPAEVYTVFEDITARKQAEAALEESKDRYRRLFEDDLTGDFLATPAGKVLLCNPAFVKIYGFSSRRRAERGNVARFNPQDWAGLVEGLRARGKIDGHQTWQKAVDGRQIHIIENVVGVFNEQKELIQVKGYVFDNTERKLAEELLKQLNATLERRVTERTRELQDAYERHRAIMDNALVGILTLNERGRIESAQSCRRADLWLLRRSKWWAATSAG